MSRHSGRCDYAQQPVPDDPECYCPGPGEQPLSCGHVREEEHLYNCRDHDRELYVETLHWGTQEEEY